VLAASRVYVAVVLWPELRERLVGEIDEIKMGDVADFRNFMGAVIDERRSSRRSG
jgi:1-pyrroline-5-carboxylate dehydrogenase